MTRDELRALARAELAAIAPDGDVEHVAGDVDLRESLDLDSLDFVRFIAALHAKTGVSIPERDYRRVYSLDGCVDYLASHTRA